MTRPSTQPLFRTEVMEARREQALGAVLLIQPVSITIFTLAAVAVAAGLVLFSFWGEYTRKARVAGYLVPTGGLIKVYSREAGTIVEKHVAEGQRVSKGDVLFVVSMERRSREAVETQGAAIARLQERRGSLASELIQQDHIARIETGALERRIDAMQAEAAQLAQEIATQERRVANAQSSHGRLRALLAQALVSEEQVLEKEKDLLDQEGRLQALQRSRISLTRELESLRAQVASSSLKARTLRAATERGISTLEQELTEYESRRAFVVAAPGDGTATAVLAERGQTANPSQPLVSILPGGADLEAHLFVPSRSVGFLAQGQTVALRYHAFPYQRFGSYRGRVAAISRTLILSNETALPFTLQEPAYRVTVTLDSQSVKAYAQDFPLQSGMLLDADIWLDRRRLYQWLLDPLYSVTGRI